MAPPDEQRAHKVVVEVVNLDADLAHIGPRERAVALLTEKAQDIEAAIQQASEIVGRSVANLTQPDGWQVNTVTATFGLALSGEAGVILSKLTAEASFEVTITIGRDNSGPAR